MNTPPMFRDFSWWVKLAVVSGIICFGVSVYLLSNDGWFPSLRLPSIVLRSGGLSLAVGGLVALVGLFVARFDRG